jgi:hypothetical protein
MILAYNLYRNLLTPQQSASSRNTLLLNSVVKFY